MAGEFGEALRRLGTAVLGVIVTRLELVTAELEAEREVRAQIAVLWVIVGFSLLFAFSLFTLLIVAAFWDTHRYAAIGIAALVYALVAAVAGLRAQHLRAHRPGLLSATIAELKADRAALTGGADERS